MTLNQWKREFSMRVAMRMKTQGIDSQRELSKRCGISETSISRYLAGERVPKITSIINLADALRVSPSYLIDFGETIDIKGMKL